MLSSTNYHNKNFALRLALKRRQPWTRKWPIRFLIRYVWMEIYFNPERKSSGFQNTCGRDLKPDSRERRKHNDYSNQSCVSLAYISLRETRLEWWIHAILGPVVQKPINLIQDFRKHLFHVFNFLVKVSFAYFCFSRSTSTNVTLIRISASNSIWE